MFRDFIKKIRTGNKLDVASDARSCIESLVGNKLSELGLYKQEMDLLSKIDKLRNNNILDKSVIDNLTKIRIIGNAAHHNKNPGETPKENAELFNKTTIYDIYSMMVEIFNAFGLSVVRDWEQLPFNIGASIYECQEKIGTRTYRVSCREVYEGDIESIHEAIIVESINPRESTVKTLLGSDLSDKLSVDYSRAVVKDAQFITNDSSKYAIGLIEKDQRWLYIYDNNTTTLRHYKNGNSTMSNEQKVQIIRSLLEICLRLDSVEYQRINYRIAHRNINPDTVFYDGQNIRLGFFHWAKLSADDRGGDPKTGLNNYLEKNPSGTVEFNLNDQAQEFMYPNFINHIKPSHGSTNGYPFNDSRNADTYSIAAVFCYLLGFSIKDRDAQNRLRNLSRSKQFDLSSEFWVLLKQIQQGQIPSQSKLLKACSHENGIQKHN